MKTNLLTLQEFAAGAGAAHSPGLLGMEFPADPGQMWASRVSTGPMRARLKDSEQDGDESNL